MGIKLRSSRKIFPGVRVNRNGSSTSYTVGGKYNRTTINTKTGRVTRTTRIPGTHVSFTTTSGNTKTGHNQPAEASAIKESSPLTYKVCGIIALVFGVPFALVGLISFSVGGWLILLFSLPLLYYGWKFLKRSKQLKIENQEGK